MDIDGQITINEISRMSLDLNFEKGQPPENMIRFALVELLTSLAKQVESRNIANTVLFPVVFPMKLTLESTQKYWSFRIVAKLENAKNLE